MFNFSVRSVHSASQFAENQRDVFRISDEQPFCAKHNSHEPDEGESSAWPGTSSTKTDGEPER